MLVIQTKDEILDCVWNIGITGNFSAKMVRAKLTNTPKSTIYWKLGIFEKMGVITVINNQSRHSLYMLNRDVFEKTFGDVIKYGW